MLVTDESQRINDFLRNFGLVPPQLKDPIFRLVWSEDMLENRLGEFAEFYGDLYVRTVKCVKLVRKYNYINNRWVLEQWYSPVYVYTPELPDSRNGSWEPFYVFEDSKRNALPLNMMAVEFLMHFKMSSNPSSALRKSLIDEYKANRAFDVDKYCDEIINDDSHLLWHLHFKEAALMPSKSDKVLGESPNLRSKKDD